LFFSLLIITLSFVPVFTLEGQEGRLFAPLAFTKTYAMAGAAILSVTLVPILMGGLIRGRIPADQANPVNRWLTNIYRPAIDWTLRRPKAVLLIAALTFATTAWPLTRLGGEGIRAAPADRPADQDRARGRECVRQGGPRRERNRPSADGDVRDDDPVQAARSVASRHDARQAHR
jgi:hypothetical protein